MFLDSLAMFHRLASNAPSSYLSLPNVGITYMVCHILLELGLNRWFRMSVGEKGQSKKPPRLQRKKYTMVRRPEPVKEIL